LDERPGEKVEERDTPEHVLHRGIQRLVRDLNRLYRAQPALYELDDEPHGFRWIDCNDAPNSVISFIRYPSFVSRRGRRGRVLRHKGVHVVVACNLTPVPRFGYRFGVPRRCAYLEVLNTDAKVYGGSGLGNLGRVEAEEVPCHGFSQSVVLTLPPLAVLWLAPELDEDPRSIEPLATEPMEGQIPPSEEAPAEPAEDESAALDEREQVDLSIVNESTLVSFDRRG
jgi:1,4-alpha-glucan branching enzyme